MLLFFVCGASLMFSECENVLPPINGPNVTKHFVTACNVCECTYESRSTTLAKAGVFITLFGILFLLTVAMVCPPAKKKKKE
eukprot:m.89719 g.89719  ORF g.89719 m.89719 type:complete len:82 (-) comp12297_c0_seq2:3359-3604(-)